MAQLCAYIDDDYQEFIKIQKNDNSLGFMIVTTGSEQARKIQKWFEKNSSLRTCLVLDKEEDNSGKQKAFKGIKNKETGQLESPYDGMIVFQMCITGFDAPRLKRLYLLRTINEHSLLQTLASIISLILERSEEHTSELQSRGRNSSAVCCLQK